MTKHVLIFLLFFHGVTSAIFAQSQPLRLWYTQPAQVWEACVPLGNGKIGAMPDGGVYKENITLNDITLWSGSKQDADIKDAHQYLPKIQQLILAGKHVEAQQLMAQYFVCKGKGSGLGNGRTVPYGCFELLANLQLQYKYDEDSSRFSPQNYLRQLSLNKATASTTFNLNQTSYTREYFTSFGNDVFIMKLSANQLKKINFSINCSRPENFETKVNNNSITMQGQLNNGVDGKGMKYSVQIIIKITGGAIITTNNQLQVSKANSAYIYVSTATNFIHSNYISHCKQVMEKALKNNYETEYRIHVRRFQSQFNKATFRIGNNVIDSISTDKRLAAFATNKNDQLLPALYFQFGRYLLISSTRRGLLPPNLQGLWAKSVNTPWNGDYHININLQMNHWPLEVTNLANLNEPFYRFVHKMIPAGQKTARAYYNAPGWVAHVITNVWQYTSPGEDYSWGSFNTGAAWLCQMLWSHYEFTGDRNYLRNIYPILHGAATFYAATLVRDSATGYRVTAPSNSPENGFILPDGKVAHVCAGPTIDNQLLRFLFRITKEAAHTLQTDQQFSLQLDSLSAQLPPNQIGADGRLLEWQLPYAEYEPKHRHISHLWALYPGYEINDRTPDLQAAAKATLKARGDEGTGWSLAWKINFWARLKDGNKAMQFLQRLLKPTGTDGFNMVDGGGTYPNLFCAHPPFQIDGNFGGTAGIAEMLVQSHENYIELLPAIPAEWTEGYYTGLCVRGGATVAVAWKNSKVKTLQIKATIANTFTIKLPHNTKSISKQSKNGLNEITTNSGYFKVSLQKGESATFQFDAIQ